MIDTLRFAQADKVKSHYNFESKLIANHIREINYYGYTYCHNEKLIPLILNKCKLDKLEINGCLIRKKVKTND